LLAIVNHFFGRLLALFLKNFQNHNRVWIGPINNSPSYINIIYTKLVASFAYGGHWDVSAAWKVFHHAEVCAVKGQFQDEQPPKRVAFLLHRAAKQAVYPYCLQLQIYVIFDICPNYLFSTKNF
jgi:hypothetical protein